MAIRDLVSYNAILSSSYGGLGDEDDEYEPNPIRICGRLSTVGCDATVRGQEARLKTKVNEHGRRDL